MVKKSAGITMHGPVVADEIPPTLHLSGKHAKKFIKHKIGAKVKMTVHGKKVSHSQGMNGNHSMSFELNKVDPVDMETARNNTDDLGM